MVATGDGISVYYFSEYGPISSEIIAERIPDNCKTAMKLVADAMCHAINSGTEYFDLLQMIERMQQVATAYKFVLGEGWGSGDMEATLDVAYWQYNKHTSEAVKIVPDVSHDLRLLQEWEEYTNACEQ